MAKNKTDGRVQYAALPLRFSEAGIPQVMLLTSRDTGRWVIPKGWPMKGKKPREAAAQEAYEEAGLIGEVIGKRPAGRFNYAKRLPEGDALCEVRVYLLRVDHQLDDWPEKAERTTQWFDASEAVKLVDEGGLAEIIANFRGILRRASKDHR